jgi:hypothetical protein
MEEMEAPPQETKRRADSGQGKTFEVNTFGDFASSAAEHGFDAVEHRARHEFFYLRLSVSRTVREF